jgi:hypothetical protein
MITRAQMPRQLRNRGGMTVKTVRQKYGLGSLVKKTIRKLIPNELADVAVKAAPFVAPFNPGAAALMRGVGRFDQRGSISDALKQGAATYGFGQAARFAGGAGFQNLQNPFTREAFSSPFGRETGFGKMFAPRETVASADITQLPKPKPVVPDKETGIVRAITDKTIAKIPGAKKLLPKSVMDQLVVGGITSGASALYSYFKGDFRPQEEGETMEEYLAARKESVGKQMRAFMDNYYRFDPEYSAMSDAERDAFVARYNMKKGGIMNVPVRTNSEGVKELDYRKTGGFVPIGVKEKADDVPAMLSKNEFVFTADAVRGAGDGSIKKGAQRMYNTMKKLESRVG